MTLPLTGSEALEQTGRLNAIQADVSAQEILNKVEVVG